MWPENRGGAGCSSAWISSYQSETWWRPVGNAACWSSPPVTMPCAWPRRWWWTRPRWSGPWRSSIGRSERRGREPLLVDPRARPGRRPAPVRADRRAEGASEGAGWRGPVAAPDDGADLREAVAAHARDVRGGDDPTRRRRGVSLRQRDRYGSPRIGARRGPQPVPLGRSGGGPRFLASDARTARRTRHRAGDQWSLRPRAPVPGGGRFLH